MARLTKARDDFDVVMDNLSDPIRLRVMIGGVRQICNRESKRKPNWVLAMSIFGVGSTYARRICARAGINPDALVATNEP